VIDAPRLRTARLVVRAWSDADKPGYAALNADAEVMAHFPATLTVDQSDEMVDRMASSWHVHGFGGWAVEIADARRFAGMVILSAPTWTEWFTPCVEVGWRFAKEHWGHGYAPEAACAVVEWGFAHLDLPNDEIVSFTTVQNTSSRRVMEKLGFTHDPADDFDHPLLGDWHEARHVLYRMSRARWSELAATRA
jgi:RimJ/RimL family protein N-acetyltransferase